MQSIDHNKFCLEEKSIWRQISSFGLLWFSAKVESYLRYRKEVRLLLFSIQLILWAISMNK